MLMGTGIQGKPDVAKLYGHLHRRLHDAHFTELQRLVYAPELSGRIRRRSHGLPKLR